MKLRSQRIASSSSSARSTLFYADGEQGGIGTAVPGLRRTRDVGSTTPLTEPQRVISHAKMNRRCHIHNVPRQASGVQLPISVGLLTLLQKPIDGDPEDY